LRGWGRRSERSRLCKYEVDHSFLGFQCYLKHEILETSVVGLFFPFYLRAMYRSSTWYLPAARSLMNYALIPRQACARVIDPQ